MPGPTCIWFRLSSEGLSCTDPWLVPGFLGEKSGLSYCLATWLGAQLKTHLAAHSRLCSLGSCLCSWGASAAYLPDSFPLGTQIKCSAQYLMSHVCRQRWPAEQSVSVIGKVAPVLDAVQYTNWDASWSLQIQIKRKQLRKLEGLTVLFCFLSLSLIFFSLLNWCY